jgi:hypothetical protein
LKSKSRTTKNVIDSAEVMSISKLQMARKSENYKIAHAKPSNSRKFCRERSITSRIFSVQTNDDDFYQKTKKAILSVQNNNNKTRNRLNSKSIEKTLYNKQKLYDIS